MKNIFKSLIVMGLLATAAPALAHPDEPRTARRSVVGDILYPQWLLNVPEHYEFSPLVSNHDPHNQHPAQWAGQDWEPQLWNASWTPEQTVDGFFKARIFTAQIMEGTVPVLRLGPQFYRLSDLDQRRSLKLVADTSGILNSHDTVMLRDWKSNLIVGSYTAKGMYLK
jgi:hypothetical protein